ncbi:translation initiation factor IF-2 isoform X1 [Ixodes scapularis]
MVRAHAKENFELACRINESLTLFPFTFRTHTHKLGKAVTGYLVRKGQWTNIGKHSPQEPQMFYPAKKGLKIVKGDVLVRLALLGHRFYLPSTYVSVIGKDDLKSWKPDAAVETA